MPKRNGLTVREKAFCEEFVLSGESPVKAYLKVYDCSPDSARVLAYRALKRPHVKEYVEKLQKDAYEAACINAERVALKLAEIAFSAKGDEDYGATSQLKALDLLQKQLGVQHQKIEADVNTDINITIEE